MLSSTRLLTAVAATLLCSTAQAAIVEMDFVVEDWYAPRAHARITFATSTTTAAPFGAFWMPSLL